MVEVECPACEGEVDVPNITGHYTCPLCDAEFEFESPQSTDGKDELATINPIVYIVGLMVIAIVLNILASVLGLDKPGAGGP